MQKQFFGAVKTALSLMLSVPSMRPAAVELLESWAYSLDRNERLIAWQLQGRVSQVTGFPICGMCQLVESPDNLHDFCRQQIQLETDAAWEEEDHRRDQELQEDLDQYYDSRPWYNNDDGDEELHEADWRDDTDVSVLASSKEMGMRI